MAGESTIDPSLLDNGFEGYYNGGNAGYQMDGTFNVPLSAQQTNNPANTAGYSSPMSQQTFALLSQGLGALGSYANLSQMIDYKKFEATNGGLFMQGQGIYSGRQVVNPNYSMLLLLVLGAVFLANG